jgi:membrane associated rhomboid family serine protease
MQCPEHQRQLVPKTLEQECPFCRGAFMDEAAFRALVGPVPVAAETREASPAFSRTRPCPACGVPMVPLRLGQLEQWAFGCPSCGGRWVNLEARRTITALVAKAAREKAWKSFTPDERTAMARELATHDRPEDDLVTELTARETVKAVVGMPVVAGAKGEELPLVTMGAMVVCAALFGMGLVDDAWSFDELAWRAHDGLFSPRLLTAMWAHAGWGHLLGNLLFLWTLGELVERRFSHGLLAVWFIAAGVASTFVQGQVSEPSTLIGGASGAIFGLLGLAAFVQPGATLKVLPPGLSLLRRGGVLAIKVPLWLGVVGYFALQLFEWQLGSRGVAWVAHLSGLAMGAVTGFFWRQRTPS